MRDSMLTEQQIIEILSSDDIPAKYAALEQLMHSQSSSRAIVEAIEKASHDEDMGVVARAIKALQSGAHHRMAVEIGMFGQRGFVSAENPPGQIPETQSQSAGSMDNPSASQAAGSESSSRAFESHGPDAVPTPQAGPITGQPSGLFPPPAGVIRRTVALFIDLLILAVICTLVGFLFSGILERLGYYSRLLTGLLALLYFSLSNSSLFSGATPGKRLMRIQVVDAHGHTIRFPLAALRSLVLVFLILFYGWHIPGIAPQNPFLVLVNLVVIGLSASILFLAFFNNRAGQSLDDLPLSTRVVYRKGVPVEAYPSTSRQVVIGALVVLVILPIAIWAFSQARQVTATNKASIQQLLPLYQALNRDPSLVSASLSENYPQTPSQQLVRLLVITLWPRLYADDAVRQKMAQDAAQLAQDGNALQGYGGLQVQIIGGYDLGFFQRSMIWLCAPPTGCPAEIVRNSILRFFNFDLNYQLDQ